MLLASTITKALNLQQVNYISDNQILVTSTTSTVHCKEATMNNNLETGGRIWRAPKMTATHAADMRAVQGRVRVNCHCNLLEARQGRQVDDGSL
ncbi:hypothetical protein PR202_ga10658 [Eleusine coracana subsp. coracana]|uniref:Uncharacterized protein n=1 Tax=Eleusine coracana subsp. coracana TaxID=191504 RepID=A0AAV5C798_ELECO|nr:hypothetical protein PR202_ga10658 [Eleusine coracana subsp. coracana]